jgi:hypothetical protein
MAVEREIVGKEMVAGLICVAVEYVCCCMARRDSCADSGSFAFGEEKNCVKRLPLERGDLRSPLLSDSNILDVLLDRTGSLSGMFG